MWAPLRCLCCDPAAFRWWAAGAWVGDLLLTALIVRRVPFTNVDWEAYMAQVDGVLRGEFDYSQLRGPTGPIAYPAGFCWAYAALRWAGVGLPQAQALFAGLYLATVAMVFEIYRRARAPGWLLVCCVLSKRVHSIFVLRLFNDALAQFLHYAALLLFLTRRHAVSAFLYSAAVSVKMQPLFCCPAVGMCLVLRRGWSHALPLIMFMVSLQVVLAVPFWLANPSAYLSQAFGGPGDLQHVWSVNWRFLPETIFDHKAFAAGLLGCNLLLWAWFAHFRWAPGGGLRDCQLWRWTRPAARARPALDDQATVCVWFACNLVGVACLRTMHFQFLVWYFHSVPFLAWFALQPELAEGGLAWALRCAGAAGLTAAVEAPFLLTSRGRVRGPDGRSWETEGVPTEAGALLLLLAHGTLLTLLARRPRPREEGGEGKEG